MNFKNSVKKIFSFPKKYIVLIIILMIIIYYTVFAPRVIISPTAEAKKMTQLEATKKVTDISPFETDGCSGNISEGWISAVETVSDFSEEFAQKYSNQKNIPFESACIIHDRKYHQGDGGYVARLNADNQLRTNIIEYGIFNWQEIVEKSPLKTEEEVIYAFEKIAEVIYRGVRVGGFPCSGQPHAWGFGYNNGVCVED